MHLTNLQYLILEKLEEINKPTLLEELRPIIRKEYKAYSANTYVSAIKTLVKKKLLTFTVDLSVKKGGNERFILTESGKEALIQKPSENTPKVKGKQKTKNSQPKKEGNWLEFTTPIWVEQNNQWEFYKKQEGQILEIFSSQDEEELKALHQSKVMQHIMAAMETPKTEEEKKRSRHPVKHNLSEEVKQSLDGSIRKVGDSSTFLHLDAKRRLMEMKLAGYPQPEILLTVAREYNLKSITVGFYLTDVIREIRERSKGLVEETLRTHLDRYEEIFKWFRENGYAKMALRALEKKEKLVGLHDNEKVDGSILLSLNQLGQNNSRAYDWSQLSDTEYKRLMSLARKTVIIMKYDEEEASDKN